jgi:hypothetical protein
VLRVPLLHDAAKWGSRVKISHDRVTVIRIANSISRETSLFLSLLPENVSRQNIAESNCGFVWNALFFLSMLDEENRAFVV